jgi:hypothetical protein
MKQNKIILNADRVFLMIEFTETIIQKQKLLLSEFNHVMMSATFFTTCTEEEERKED